MSGTITEPEGEEPELVETEEIDQPVATEPAEATDPEGERKPSQGDRRFANMTARMDSLQRELTEANRRREAAEALVNAGKEPETPPQPLDRDAIRAEIRFESARDGVVDRGRKEFGMAEFDAQAAILASLGATGNPAFMQALVEIPNAERLVAEFSTDTDSLVALLKKTPVAMAAEMGRMAAKMETQAAPLTPRRASNAPRPVQPVESTSTTPEPDIYSPKMTAEQWKAIRTKTAPRSLGGRG